MPYLTSPSGQLLMSPDVSYVVVTQAATHPVDSVRFSAVDRTLRLRVTAIDRTLPVRITATDRPA